MNPYRRALREIDIAIREASTADGRHWGGHSYGVEQRWALHHVRDEQPHARPTKDDETADRRA